MSTEQEFKNEFSTSYLSNKDTTINLGGAVLSGACLGENFHVQLPLKYFNRHGLISGATGSGKTKSLQLLVEELSKNGVPSFLMDIKGDLSGLARAGSLNPRIETRHKEINIPFTPQAFPVELMSLTGASGLQLRTTIIEMGPILLAKALGLNDTQQSALSIIYKFCDDNALALIDLKDMMSVLNYFDSSTDPKLKEHYGDIPSATLSVIKRKIIALEGQGANCIFSEPSFEPEDLLQIDRSGYGQVSILRLNDIQDKPELFSTFVLSLLAEIYSTFPEMGDVTKPKLMIFIDEAHLFFKEATKELLNQLDTMIKLIRSKGVGIVFITQDPNDVPENILGQLGFKIQHSLRAFTAKDQQNIKLMSRNFPISKYYVVENLLTELGVGEALITGLGEGGKPTLLTHTKLRTPGSRMDILTNDEIEVILKSSYIYKKYKESLDPESAYEKLAVKMQEEQKIKLEEKEAKNEDKKDSGSSMVTSIVSIFGSAIVRNIANNVAREVTRGLMGSLGLSKSRRR